MAGFGTPDFESGSYTYGTQFPPMNCEGDQVMVTLRGDLTALFLADADGTLGLIKNIPADIFPTEVHFACTDVDTNATETYDTDLAAITNDDGLVQIVNTLVVVATGTQVGASWSLDDGGTDFATGDSLEDLRLALQVSSVNVPYDLVLDNQALAATAAAGTFIMNIKFVRDVRDPGEIFNPLIADGQA